MGFATLQENKDCKKKKKKWENKRVLLNVKILKL